MSEDTKHSVLVAFRKGHAGGYEGLILEAGGYLSEEIRDIGSPYADDLGLPDPPSEGLWLSENLQAQFGGDPESGPEVVGYEGEYRRLRLQELRRLTEGQRVLLQAEWEPPE